MSKDTKIDQSLVVRYIGVPSFNLLQKNFSKENTNVRFGIDNNLRFAVEKNIINLRLLIRYNHPDMEPFLVMEIENIFELTGLDKYIPKDKIVTPEEMKIPEKFLIIMASQSVSHARALIGHNIAGTFAQGIYLPIIDNKNFAKNVFGDDKVK